MRLDRRSVGRFAVHFLLLFPVFAFVYYHALLPYQQLVVGLANPLLAWLSPGIAIELDLKGGWHTFLLGTDGSRAPFYSMRPAALNLIYLNLALLPPLLLATPVPLRTRLRLLAWGVLLLVACHVLAVVGLVRTYHCLQVDPESFLCGWIRGTLKVSGQLFAVMQWALVTWRHWLPQTRR